MTSKSEISPENEATDMLRGIYDRENTNSQVDPQVPASRYIRSGTQMLLMANQYEADGDLIRAYTLYIRITRLLNTNDLFFAYPDILLHFSILL